MLIRRIIGLAFVGLGAVMVGGAVTALSVKQRTVSTTDEDANEVTLASIFGPLAFHSTAKAFTGGSVECWYGGGVLDLRDAVMSPEGATLRLRAIFGGGQILVPPTWTVVTNVAGFGGVTDVRTAAGSSDDAPRLTIDAVVFAGGFAVTSELAEGEAEWLDEMHKTLDPEPEAALTV
jgi:hypothetical protein